MPDEYRNMLDFLCSNHTRGLPLGRFQNKMEEFLKENLGEDFARAATETGGRNRLEMSGEALLRSVAKLGHAGPGAYEKGDGLELDQWIKRNYPHLGPMKFGRVELSKRQDWALEVAENIQPFILPIIQYCIESLILDANVLRDSTLQRLELFHFDAYIQVSATMWVVAFEELRWLTNANGINRGTPMNPIEIHDMCVFDVT